MEYISDKQIRNILKKRTPYSHKGTYGRVLVAAGSEGMAGAAVLSASGALRAGAGLVNVSIDKKLFPIVQSSVTEATCVERDISPERLKTYNSVIIGPGLGTSNDGARIVAKLLKNYKGSMVMDADALNILSQNDEDFKKSEAGLIITPHPGEAARLIRSTAAEVNCNREKVVSFLAASTNAVAVLKGHRTLVGIPEAGGGKMPRIFVCPTGNPGMATGGSGDVLSGIIGGFLAQGMSREEAAVAGVYVHGKAGDLAADELGEYGLIAGDLPKYVAYAIKDIQVV